MPDQDALLPGRPADEGGIWRRYLDHGTINHQAWLRARAEAAPVGSCRRCGADLIPEPPHDRGNGRIDYTAECQDPACAYVVAAPGGRVIRGDTTAWSKSNGAARVAALLKARKEAAG